jgi:hypothetical protein
MEEGRFSAAVLARQHDQRMREIHDHRHVKVEIGEDGVTQDFEVHGNPA